MSNGSDMSAFAQANGRGMQRLQFELALDLTGKDERPLKDAIRDAAQSVGADLLFVLPSPTGEGVVAVVRLDEEGTRSFLQVRFAKGGFTVFDEAGMDPNLLGLARASVEVFERMSADRAIREPLAALG